MHDFVNGKAFRPFIKELTGLEIYGYHPGNFFKLAASQSPSIAAPPPSENNATRRLFSRIIIWRQS